MKFLPITFREKQSDLYGQKGIHWHVSMCVYKDENSNLNVRLVRTIQCGNSMALGSLMVFDGLYGCLTMSGIFTFHTALPMG